MAKILQNHKQKRPGKNPEKHSAKTTWRKPCKSLRKNHLAKAWQNPKQKPPGKNFLKPQAKTTWPKTFKALGKYHLAESLQKAKTAWQKLCETLRVYSFKGLECGVYNLGIYNTRATDFESDGPL